MDRRFLPTIIVAAALLISGSAPLAAGQAGTIVPIDDHRILGDRNARVTMIEFADYQCPLCRRFWKETLPLIKQQYIDTGKVRLVYWDFTWPNHPEAIMSAIAAECAADQGKYWEYHDKLFRSQAKGGSDVVRFKARDLQRWATEIGLAAAPFNACLDSAKYKDKVAATQAYGAVAGVGVDGTPAFFIGGRRVVGAQPFAVFQQAIEDELGKQQD